MDKFSFYEKYSKTHIVFLNKLTIDEFGNVSTNPNTDLFFILTSTRMKDFDEKLKFNLRLIQKTFEDEDTKIYAKYLLKRFSNIINCSTPEDLLSMTFASSSSSFSSTSSSSFSSTSSSSSSLSSGSSSPFTLDDNLYELLFNEKERETQPNKFPYKNLIYRQIHNYIFTHSLQLPSLTKYQTIRCDDNLRPYVNKDIFSYNEIPDIFSSYIKITS